MEHGTPMDEDIAYHSLVITTGQLQDLLGKMILASQVQQPTSIQNKSTHGLKTVQIELIIATDTSYVGQKGMTDNGIEHAAISAPVCRTIG